MATTTFSAGDRIGGLAPALPYVAAAAIYLVVLAVGGNLLNDPDTYWHIATGRWIAANGFPHADPFSFSFAGQPWIAKEWLSQVLLAAAGTAGGWTGVVVLTAAAIALAFGLLTRFLQERMAPLPALAFAAVAFMLVAPHATARPHVFALPVMVAWVAGLVRANDERRAPPYRLLPLMVLWANLHAGFTLGLVLAVALALDAIFDAPREVRRRAALVWVRFVVLAIVAGCITPYGPGSMLATVHVLGLGPALSIIGEWKPADFTHLAGLELALLVGGGLALWRGVTLPPVRILILLGLVHMALSAERNAELIGLLVPLVVATPLSRQIAEMRSTGVAPFGAMAAAFVAMMAALMVPATASLAALSGYAPNPRISPVAAVASLTAANAGRVLNDYDFGGYLIAAGVPTFIDGRSELYGSGFILRDYRAVNLIDLGDFHALLDEYRIDATLLAPGTPAVAALDRDPAWKRLYADDAAVVHVRLALRPTLH